MDANALAYYSRPGIMTDAGTYSRAFAGLPTDLAALVEVVQGLLVHVFWAERYGLRLPPDREAEVGLRNVEQKMERLLAIDPAPLTEERPLSRRLVGNCRDFSVLLCAMLRQQGVPARARAGFGTYFRRGHFEDHWVCEVWQNDEERWVLVDAQLDAFQREALHIAFDPLDVPREQFVSGGEAWLQCRHGQADADDFGILDMHGYAFVRGNVVRDFLALNKIELLPWDAWGPMASSDAEAITRNVALIDRLARLTTSGDALFLALRATYENERRQFGVPVPLLERVAAG
ncbi:MAG: transglutaminase domain-containing protein [Chloroflexi bacterium]|nr:transglutaminase domain-containing protein [Chloroflexota bacterium]